MFLLVYQKEIPKIVFLIMYGVWQYLNDKNKEFLLSNPYTKDNKRGSIDNTNDSLFKISTKIIFIGHS